MSWVTNLVISFDSDDSNVDAIQQWFEENTDSFIVPLHESPEHYGGTKCLETSFLVGAYNYLRLDELLDFLYELEWEFPESLQVLVKGEEDNIFTDRIDQKRVKCRPVPPIPPVERFQDPVWAETDEHVNLRVEPDELEKAMQEMAMNHPHDPERLAAKLLSLVTVHKDNKTGTGRVTYTDVPILTPPPAAESKPSLATPYWVTGKDDIHRTNYRGFNLEVKKTDDKIIWNVRGRLMQAQKVSHWPCVASGNVAVTLSDHNFPKVVRNSQDYAAALATQAADYLWNHEPPANDWHQVYGVYTQAAGGGKIAGVATLGSLFYWFVMDKVNRNMLYNAGRGSSAISQAQEIALERARIL